MIIIGNGAHARDIAQTCRKPRLIPHHSNWGGWGPFIIGINDPQVRAKVAADIGGDDVAWVHPDAKLYVDCSYGYGTHINYGVTMTRTTIGVHTTISPGVTICGDVMIGDRVLIGAGATICDRVTIGDDAIVGAGAVVLPQTVVAPHQTVMGVPAKTWTGGR